MVVTLVLEWRDVIPGAPYLTQFFTEKGAKVNKTDWQRKWWMKMCVPAVLAYHNLFINDKVNHSNFFLPVEKKKTKKKKPIKSKKNLEPFSRKNPIPKRMSRRRVAHSNDILRTLLSRCCKVLSFFQRYQQEFFWFDNSLLTMNNTVTKRDQYLALRRVKYYKDVKSYLCYNVTWRNRPTALAGEQQLTRWMFSSIGDYRMYLCPVQLKKTV